MTIKDGRSILVDFTLLDRVVGGDSHSVKSTRFSRREQIDRFEMRGRDSSRSHKIVEKKKMIVGNRPITRERKK
jgi:hypothetical protein